MPTSVSIPGISGSLWLDLFGPTLIVGQGLTDSAGAATIQVPIPAGAGLDGGVVHFQAVLASGGSLALSRAIFVRIGNPTIIREPAGGPAGFGGAAVAGDFNGDGFEDLAVSNPFRGSGHVFVFDGSGSGLGAAPSRTINSPTGNLRFGQRLAAGNANGDAFVDLVISDHGHGVPSPVGCSPSTTWTLGATHVYAGGLAAGPPSSIVPPMPFTGRSTLYTSRGVAMAPIDPTVVTDVVIGTVERSWSIPLPCQNEYARGIVVQLNGQWTKVDDPQHCRYWNGVRYVSRDSAFGDSQRAIATGDVDGDGSVDVFVTARLADNPPAFCPGPAANTWEGAVYGFSNTGGALSLQWALHGAVAGDRLGGFGVSIGNINGDAYDDVVVLGNGSTGNRVLVYLGSPAGPASTPIVLQPMWQVSNYTSIAAQLADLDGNGVDDVIFTHQPLSGFRGAASVYLGGPTFAVDAVRGIVFDHAGVPYGADVNRNGADDLLIVVRGTTNGWVAEYGF